MSVIKVWLWNGMSEGGADLRATCRSDHTLKYLKVWKWVNLFFILSHPFVRSFVRSFFI